MFSKTRTSICRPGQLLSVLLQVRFSYFSCLCTITPHKNRSSLFFILQILPTFWICWHPFTGPLNSPAGNAFFRSPSQERPTLLKPVNYITVLFYASSSSKMTKQNHGKEGRSTAFLAFKSICVHKTELTGWRMFSPSVLPGFQVDQVAYEANAEASLGSPTSPVAACEASSPMARQMMAAQELTLPTQTELLKGCF